MDARALTAALSDERARFVRMARSRVRTEADAEDVVQRAMLRAAERAAALADPSRARAWFYRILRRAIADHHRSRPADASGGHEEAVEGVDTASAPPPVSPCACAVHLLADLRPAYAEVLRRVDLDGEDPSVVATAIGASTASLYVRLHRARRALRDRVERHCGVSSLTPCLHCTCHAHERCGS
jgi:RNA polymerase sigma-70 factor (ECF subfamily)